MKRLITILWIFCSFDLSSQQIIEAEYFIDTDPGFGSGTPITITPNQDISDLSVSIDINAISDGIHNLNVRAKDDNGSWSLAHQQIFLKSQLPSSSPIVELEYYFDNDPGEGNGNSLSITSGVDISNHLSNISTSGVSEGVHKLCIRTKNDEGIWSHVASRPVYISAPITIKDIVELEYFVGADPGYGNGTSISISAANDLSNISASIPIGNLEYGVNQLSIRGQNSTGQWSHSNTKSILRMKAPDIPDIVEMEYFFNDDPGLGNGTFVSYAPAPDWPDLSVLVNTSSLSDGLHILYIRSKDSNGVWSFSNSVVIQKTTIVELSDITAMEYFFDVDPGFGMGTSIGISPDTDINNKVTNISVAGLSKGIHTLFLRSKNELGEWSLSQTKTLLIAKPATTKDIEQLEYYFDTDPGFGMGTAVSIDTLPNISDLDALFSLSGLSKGVHEVYVRSKDSYGQWSQTYHKTFLYRAPNVIENIQKMEYFVGDDPGLGNGIDITVPGFTAVPDIMDLQHLIDVNSLDAGVQRINIRSQDELGVWSHTYMLPIYVYKNVNGNMVKAEYFIDADPGHGMATEISFTPQVDKSDHIFPIDISGLEYGIYRLHVRYMSENNKWTMDEVRPFYYKDDQLYEMVEGEYFIDIDPGLGMATPFSFTAGVDVPDLSIFILTTGLDAGDHDLYIRTKNANGEWSLTNVKFDIEIESTLPLRFLSFEVRKHGDDALLDWKVNEAVNTSHFEIERTRNSDFAYLGRVKSINDLAEIDYQFTDTDPFEGMNYYRLKQVDLDGNFQYGPIRSVNFGAQNSITVYPNPSINEIRIEGKVNDDASYLIYDSANRLVDKGRIMGNSSVDVSELIPGAYHFILRSGTNHNSFLIIKI